MNPNLKKQQPPSSTKSSSNRVVSTVKKSQSTQIIQNNVGNYRPLGPKIHDFALSPQQMQSPSAQQNYNSSANINYQNSMQNNQANTQNQLLQISLSQSQFQQSILPNQNQSQFNSSKIDKQYASNGFNSVNTQIDHNGYESLRVNNKLSNNQIGNPAQNQHKKKNSFSTIGSPLNNASNRSSGWAGNGLTPTNVDHSNFRQNNHQISNNNVSALNGNNNNSRNSENHQNGQYLDNYDSVQSMEQFSEAEAGQNIVALKMQLRTIFHFYTTFGDRQNITYLKSNKFYKMMADANIISSSSPHININRLDLLFCQVNKHRANMSFETFLDMLPLLAQLKYPNTSAEEAMLSLITNELNPLYLGIMEKTDLGLELRSFNLPLEIECIEVLTPLYPVLQKIYESYFKWEPTNSLKKEDNYSKSLKALFQFLSEYNICPTYYTKSTAFLLYNFIVELQNLNLQFGVAESSTTIFGFKDYGMVFTFQRFLLFLIRSSIICYENRIETSKYVCSSHVEKLNLLLEKMEVSEGFLNIQKKTHMTNNSHTSLLIPTNLVMRLSQNKSIDWSTPRTSQYCSFRSKLNSGLQSTRQQSFFNPPASGSPSRNNSNLRKSFLAEKLGQSFANINVFEKNNENLQKIFKYYCSYGEPMNQATLKTFKLIRLLTDAGIMKKPKISTSQNHSLNLSDIKGLNKSSTSSHMKGSQTPATAQYQSHKYSNSIAQGSILASGDEYQLKGQRYLSKIDMDFMVVKLTGSKWIKTFNQQTNKASQIDPKISSPKLGFTSHMYKNDESLGAKGKIEYEHFVKLLEMIAEKLYPELDIEQSLQIIVESQILKLLEQTQPNRKGMHDYLANLMDILKDQEIVNLLGEVHLSLVMYYKIYQDQKGYMNITSFIKFFQDFDIFPSLVSKAKLQAIFYTLAQVQANQKNSRQKQQNETMHNTSRASQMFLNDSLSSNAPDQNESEIIDQHLFVEGIALLAIEIYSEKQKNLHKIIMILERMNSSQGPIKIQKQLGHTRSPDGLHWDMLHNIRKKYTEFYKTSNYATITNQQNSYYQQDQNQSVSKSFIQNSPPTGRFDEVLKKSLNSIKMQNSINLNLSQQYLLQQKDINERSQIYQLNQNSNNQSQAPTQNFSSNNNSESQRMNNKDTVINGDNIVQNEDYSTNEPQLSPLNVQNKNKFDNNSTAKKTKNNTLQMSVQQQYNQQQIQKSYESPNFLTQQTHN
ncbi:hypothetical protein ABPG74_005138 [Tetrahymena malaccensis]